MADNTINIDLVLNAAQSAKTLAEQRKALKDLQSTLGQLEEGSVAFNQIAEAAGSLKDQIGDLRAQTNFYADDLRTLSGLSDIGEGLAAGFGLATSALEALGVSSSTAEEAIKKLQIVQTALNSIQAIGNLIQKESAGNILLTNTLRRLSISLQQQEVATTTADTVATGANTVATTANAAATTGLTLAQRALNAVQAISPMGILIGIATALTAAYAFLTTKTDEQTEAEKKATAQKKALADEQKKFTDYIGKEAAGYVTLVEQLKQTNPKSQERLTLINQINSTYGTTLKNISDENAFQQQLNTSIETYIEFLKTKYALQANESLIEKNLSTQAKLEAELIQLNKDRLTAQINYDTRTKDLKDFNQEQAKELLGITAIDAKIADVQNKLTSADNRLKGYVKNSLDASNKIAASGLKTADETIKASDKSTQKIVDNYEKQAEAAKKYYDELEQLRIADDEEAMAMQDESFYKYSTAASKFYSDLEQKYNQDLEKYQASLDKKTKLNDEALKAGTITQAQYNEKIAEDRKQLDGLIWARTRKLEEDAGKFRSDIERELVENTINLNRTELENKLAQIKAEYDAKKGAVDKEKELNKELSDTQKASLQDQTIALVKQLDAQKALILKRETERAQYVTQMNETRTTEERLIYQGIIEDIDKLQVKTREEIKTNTDLLAVKEEQLALNEKLYGSDAAAKQVEELANVEKTSIDARTKAIDDYYTKQKEQIQAVKEQIIGLQEGTINVTIFNQGDFTNIEDYINHVTKTIDEYRKTSAAQLSSKDLIDPNTGEVLLEAYSKLNAAQKKEREETAREYELKAEKEQAFLDSNVAAYEEAQFKIQEAEANSANALIKLDKEVAELRNENIDGTTKKLKDSGEELGKWYTDLTNEQKLMFDQTMSFITQQAQLIADLASRSADKNIAEIERQTEAELNAFDERQTIEDMRWNDAETKDYIELNRKNEIAAQRAQIEEEAAAKVREEKRRAFNAQKAASIIEIAINTAVGISKAIPNPILMGIAGFAGAAQAAFVATQPTPEYALGGILDGPSHSNGGIKTAFGELEGGEAVINKKSTKKFKPLLSAINEAGGGVKFADGGTLPVQPMVMQDNSKLDRIEMMLERFANKPILTYVNESEVTRAQRNQRKIEKRTTF